MMKYVLIKSTTALLITVCAVHKATAAEIRADITGIKTNKGQIRCALFKSAKGFPGESKDTIQQDALQIKELPASTAAPVICDFRELVSGIYAISVLHDENEDGLLNKNFLGLPTESYGVSNNITPAMRAPTFDESKFTVDTETQLRLSIQLK